VVHDDQNGGEWQGEIGYEGWARAVEADSVTHSIIWMQRIAYVVRGTLGGTLSGGSATLTVGSYSDGVDPGATVTVYDPDSHWPNSVSTGKAVALYNYEQSRYEVIHAEQSEWIATAVALQDFTPADSVVSISISVYKTHQPYMPDPATPTTAVNTFGLTGFSGDLLHVQKSKATGLWEILVPDARNGSSGSSVPLVRFRLTENLQIGGNAAGVLLSFPGYGAAGTIRVFDRPYSATALSPGGTRGMWSGIAFQEGWARKREAQEFSLGPPEYEIVWMEQFGRFIFGTLTEDMGATNPQEATATIDYMFGQGDAVTTEEITVHDDKELFPFALEGAGFFAVRNEYLDTDHPETPYYQLAVCQQTGLYGRAQLAEDMLGSESPTVETTQFQVWSPSLYNQQLPEGEPGSVENTFNLAGVAGDKVFLVGDFHDPEDVTWHIVQVEHKDQQFITQIRFNSVAPNEDCIQYKKREGVGMFYEEESDWINVICGEECEDAE